MLRLVLDESPHHPIYLMTSVLEGEVLSDSQVMAMDQLRWGVELFYRQFKQTFGRRKLR